MTSQVRIAGIRKSPISWKERDLLTAAEKFLIGTLELPLVEFTLPCFPTIDESISKKITYVWACNCAALHLHKATENTNPLFSKTMQLKAARIYEQEAQRLLGSIFLLDHSFWKAFYTRQELEETKPIVALDALHFYTHGQEQIRYQLLVQSLKTILKGYYEKSDLKINQYQIAKRLLIDQPVPQLQLWLDHQISNTKQ